MKQIEDHNTTTNYYSQVYHEFSIAKTNTKQTESL